ncbi:MAG: M56 family metallopeptidase [Defluviitaleaceae bacterium]|nr:M56 family metallopeptidase [Defluviitaleaceae bacterium]
MTAIFIAVLNMSIAAGIVALAVMLARIPLRKAPKVFSYALWGMVLFRLVIPFSFESAFSLMPAPANVIPQDIVISSNPAIQTGAPLIDVPINAGINDALPPALIENSVNPVQVILTLAGYAWAIGFIALLSYAIFGYIRLKRRVRFATLVQDNIFETDTIKTPFVLGFIRPKIYFPTAIDPSTPNYRHILKHEQIHIKRRDYLIKPLAYTALALHWFNPLMWIAYYLMSKDLEMSCDEAVLKETAEDIRRDYSTFLLNLSVEQAALSGTLAFAVGEHNVKERVANVLHFKQPARWIVVLSYIVVAIFLVGFSSNRVVDLESVLWSHPTYPAADWHTDTRGFRVVGAAESEAIGTAILTDYFSAFRYDWESWTFDDLAAEGNIFAPIAGNPWGDAFSRFFIESSPHQDFSAWFGRVPEDIGGDNADGSRWFIPAFMFHINQETGRLLSASYTPPTFATMAYTNPLTFIFPEPIINHNEFGFTPLETMQAEYEDALIAFSLDLLSESGFAGDEVVSASITNGLGRNVDTGFMGISVHITYASGGYGELFFWLSEEGFTVARLQIIF